MAFKYEDGKVVQVSPPHVIGKDAKQMLNAKPPKELIARVRSRNFITVKAS